MEVILPRSEFANLREKKHGLVFTRPVADSYGCSCPGADISCSGTTLNWNTVEVFHLRKTPAIRVQTTNTIGKIHTSYSHGWQDLTTSGCRTSCLNNIYLGV